MPARRGNTIRRHCRLILLGLALCVVHLACAPKFVGPTTAGYYVAVIHDPSIYLPEQSQLIVRVQNARGQPLDGIPVTFQVEPSWANLASVTPQQAVTRKGTASAFLQARTIGLVHVIVTVDQVSRQVRIAVSPRPSPPGGA